uniref:Uncharacterized protein n=1 Tax=Meloidogyne enterolobii TaxID=390850 RepID=A0A6V7TU46_MELEN|nr:unnamed protein product [Meloidogyne enterolobii]
MPKFFFQISPNSLLSIWYCIICSLLQGWLIFLGFERYRLYTEIQWPTGSFPRLWLTIFISVLGACIPLIALFLVSSLIKVGNLANDNDKLGARPRRVIELVKGGKGQNAQRKRRKFSYRLCHCIRSIWTHGPPPAQSLHLLIALLQLFAHQTMLAQLYRYGFINSGDFLNSEFDFAFQRARQLATNLPMGETRLQSFKITSDELSASPLAPNLLPILMHARLFGIPLEFTNLLVALIAFSTTYPAVFWRASRAFSILFSIFLFVQSANIMWTYFGFSILFRIQETNFYGPRPVGIGQHLWALRSLPFLFHPLALIAAFWLILALMQLAPIALYSFGYAKFTSSQSKLRHLNRCRRSDPSFGRSPQIKTNYEPCMQAEDIVISSTFCDGLTPHVFSITLLLLVAAVKAPAFYAIGLLYYKEEKPFLLCCLMADLVYMFVWVLLWCILTIKCLWPFRVHYEVQELISLQDAHKISDGKDCEKRSPNELKNALLLVHGDNMFLTDDPVAKPSIMRQVINNCSSNDFPLWLRSGAQMAPAITTTASTSLPGSYSLQRRTFTSQHTPDLGHRHQPLKHFQSLQQPQHFGLEPRSPDSSPVPLAAPPYQRVGGSLPPLIGGIDEGRLMKEQMTTNNAVCTLQQRQRDNEYATYRASLLPQQNYLHYQNNSQNQQQGTLTRSFNSTSQQPQSSPMINRANLPINPNINNNLQCPTSTESYATIQRRCSKTSIASSGLTTAAQHIPSLVNNSSSPNQNRSSNRSNSLAQSEYKQKQTNLSEPPQIMAVLKQQNNNENGYNTQKRYGTLTKRNGGGGGDGVNNTLRIYDGVHPQRIALSLSTTNNQSTIDKNQQHQYQKQTQNTLTFGDNWQSKIEATGGGSSLNGTGTPSGSITLGSSNSRVGSAASSSTTSQATFEAVDGYRNTSFGNDYGTLTRKEINNGNEIKQKGGEGGGNLALEAAQWKRSKPTIVTNNKNSDFATSVV